MVAPSCENTSDVENYPTAYNSHRSTQHRKERSNETPSLYRKDNVDDEVCSACG